MPPSRIYLVLLALTFGALIAPIKSSDKPPSSPSVSSQVAATSPSSELVPRPSSPPPEVVLNAIAQQPSSNEIKVRRRRGVGWKATKFVVGNAFKPIGWILDAGSYLRNVWIQWRHEKARVAGERYFVPYGFERDIVYDDWIDWKNKGPHTRSLLNSPDKLWAISAVGSVVAAIVGYGLTLRGTENEWHWYSNAFYYMGAVINAPFALLFGGPSTKPPVVPGTSPSPASSSTTEDEPDLRFFIRHWWLILLMLLIIPIAACLGYRWWHQSQRMRPRRRRGGRRGQRRRRRGSRRGRTR
jgi:hypothetical protein